MDYDVFISYASEDREWADRVCNELKAQTIRNGENIKVFIDHIGIRAAEKWEPQLLEHINKSQHLLLLWSDHSGNSDWVKNEIGNFQGIAFKRNDGSKLIPVLLNGKLPGTVRSTQSINDILNKKLYEDFNNIEQATWNQLIQRIKKTMLDKSVRPIYNVVLTMTDAQFDKIVDAEPFSGTKTLGELLDDAGLERAEIKSKYGPGRNDWMPFGETKSISKILDAMIVQINKKDRDIDYEWIPLSDEKFWDGSLEDFRTESAILVNELSVIILDPVALFHPKVRAKFELLWKCFENGKALIMVFSPFEHTPVFKCFRSLIELGANRFHSEYFDPPIPRATYAHLIANPLDSIDARRFIQEIISQGKVPAAMTTNSSNVFPTTK